MIGNFFDSGLKGGSANSLTQTIIATSNNESNQIPTNGDALALRQDAGIEEQSEKLTAEIPMEVGESHGTPGALMKSRTEETEDYTNDLRYANEKETIARTILRHFSNLAINTDESWISAYADFSKTWQTNNSFNNLLLYERNLGTQRWLAAKRNPKNKPYQ